MLFARFETHVIKHFAIVLPRYQVISNCDVMLPWSTLQNNRLMISRFAILSRELVAINSVILSEKNRAIKGKKYKFTFGINNKFRVGRYGMNAMNMYTLRATDMHIRVLYPVCKLGPVVSTALDTTAQIHWFHTEAWDKTQISLLHNFPANWCYRMFRIFFVHNVLIWNHFEFTICSTITWTQS